MKLRGPQLTMIGQTRYVAWRGKTTGAIINKSQLYQRVPNCFVDHLSPCRKSSRPHARLSESLKVPAETVDDILWVEIVHFFWFINFCSRVEVSSLSDFMPQRCQRSQALRDVLSRHPRAKRIDKESHLHLSPSHLTANLLDPSPDAVIM